MPLKNKNDYKEYQKNYRNLNKERILNQRKAYRKANRRVIRDQYLKRTYNITLEQYEILYESQGNKCAICLNTKKHIGYFGSEYDYAVDHNHKTGIVRGILCHSCNRALGLLKDKFENIERAYLYMKRFQDD